MKEFKYKAEIEKFDCNLSNFNEQSRIAFRWTFEGIKDDRNFKPRYLLKPTINRTNCIGWGLSFFDSKENGKGRMNKLKSHTKNINKKLGTHIASGQLIDDDGISDNTDINGHFTLFEYNDLDLSNKFVIVEQS